MVKIDVLFTRREVEGRELQGEVAVVIDVLRATTTIATALSHGAAALFPVGSVSDARAVASQYERAVLGGERGGLPPEGFDAGNSPLEYTAELVRGRHVVLTTTNGTQALKGALACRPAAIATGALINASAVARWIVSTGRDVTLVCSGTEGEFSLEDVAGAGCIVARCLTLDQGASLTDAAHAAKVLWEHYARNPEQLFVESRHGRRLKELGFDSDLRYCAEVDKLDLLPIWSENRLIRGKKF